MPYDIETGRWVSDEEAEALERGTPAPPPPMGAPTPGQPQRSQGVVSRLGDVVSRLGDAATAAVDYALGVSHRLQAIQSGQERLSWEPFRQITGIELPSWYPERLRKAQEAGLRVQLGMSPLHSLTWPQELKRPMHELMSLPVRPSAAIVSPALEAVRRLRVGEEPETLSWYAQQGAREIFRGTPEWVPGVPQSWREAPDTDLFASGMQIAGGRGEPRWWSLLAGEAASLLPIVPLLLVSRGPASTRGMQRVGARASRTATEYLRKTVKAQRETFERVADAQFMETGRWPSLGDMEALERVLPRVEGQLRSVADRWWAGRRTIGERVAEMRRDGKGLPPEQVARDLTRLEGEMMREVRVALREAGLSETYAEMTARAFANDVQWGAAEGWRVAGLRLGRSPSTRSAVAQARRQAQTVTGRDPAGLRTIADLERPVGHMERSAAEMGVRSPEPLRTSAAIDAEFYGPRSSARSRAARTAAEESVIEPTVVQAEPIAQAEFRRELARYQRDAQRFREEAGRYAEPEAAPATAPAAGLMETLPEGAFARGSVGVGPAMDVGALAGAAGRVGVAEYADGSRGVEAPIEAQETAPAAPETAPEVVPQGSATPPAATEAPAASEVAVQLPEKLEWIKGEDFIDGSPRYSLEGRDPSNSVARIRVVIYQEKVYEGRRGDPPVKRYFASVYDTKAEHEWRWGPYRYLKEAKAMAEETFREQEANALAEERAQRGTIIPELQEQVAAPAETPAEVVQAPVEAPSGLPAPGELVTVTETAFGGRVSTGRVVPDPDTGQPLVSTAADGTPVAAFERTDGSTTFIPWIDDAARVAFSRPSPEPPSAREALDIPEAPPELPDAEARATIARNIRRLNAALDEARSDLARMAQLHGPSPEGIVARQALRTVSAARDPRSFGTDAVPAPGDPAFNAEAQLEELVAEIYEVRDERALSDMEWALIEVEQTAADIAAAVYEETLAQGLPNADAVAARDRAAAAYRLLHSDLIRQAVAREDLAEAQAALGANVEPQSVADLEGLVALKEWALQTAREALGTDLLMPELERYSVSEADASGVATTTEQARAMLEDGEVLPGETPVETVVRETIEQSGGEFTGQMRDLVREAEYQRLIRLAERAEGTVAELIERGPQAQEFARTWREGNIRSAMRTVPQRLADARETLSLYFGKYPGVRPEKKATLARIETRSIGLTNRLSRYVAHIFGGRPHLGLGPMPFDDRVLVTRLMEARQLKLSGREQLQTVMGEGVTEAIANDALNADGTVNYEALPNQYRRIFEVADALRDLYDAIYEGKWGLASFREIGYSLWEYRNRNVPMEQREPPPGYIEGYFPQPDITATGPGDFQFVNEMAVVELLLGQQAVEQFRAQRPDMRRERITQRRKYTTLSEKEQAKIEQAERGVEAGVPEPDALTAATHYIRQYRALLTAHGVYEWLSEHAHTAQDFVMDPAVGERGLQELQQSGWGPPTPFGTPLAGTEHHILPPAEQAALNSILAPSTLPTVFGATFQQWVLKPLRQYLRPLQVAPLVTLPFGVTNITELVSTMVTLGLSSDAPALGAGFAVANRLLAHDLLEIVQHVPPNTWVEEAQVAALRARDRLFKLFTDRFGVTDADIDQYLREMERHNILGGSIGSHARDEIHTMLGNIGLAKTELDALGEVVVGMTMNIDRLARTWAYMSLRLAGHTADAAGKQVREWSVNYDEAAHRPWYELFSAWAFYWRWTAERTAQFGSLVYKRPGVFYLLGQLDEDKERMLGFSPAMAAIVRGGQPEWMKLQLTIMPLRRGAGPSRDIADFLATTEFLEAWDGYQVFYMPIRIPLLDFASESARWLNEPIGETLDMGVPLVRGVHEAERAYSGKGLQSRLMRQMPGIGPYVRASERMPIEAWPGVIGTIGPMQAVAEAPVEVFERVVDEGRTPQQAQADERRWKRVQWMLDQGVPRSQTEPGRYEVEKMQFLVLLEQAKRRWGLPLYTASMADAHTRMLPEELEVVIRAIDGGQQIYSRPGETPEQYRRTLEMELARRREGKGPQTEAQQAGGLARKASEWLHEMRTTVTTRED